MKLRKYLTKKKKNRFNKFPLKKSYEHNTDCLSRESDSFDWMRRVCNFLTYPDGNSDKMYS